MQKSRIILIEGKKLRGKIRTRDLWSGIHRTQDVIPSKSKDEH